MDIHLFVATLQFSYQHHFSYNQLMTNKARVPVNVMPAHGILQLLQKFQNFYNVVLNL